MLEPFWLFMFTFNQNVFLGSWSSLHWQTLCNPAQYLLGSPYLGNKILQNKGEITAIKHKKTNQIKKIQV